MLTGDAPVAPTTPNMDVPLISQTATGGPLVVTTIRTVVAGALQRTQTTVSANRRSYRGTYASADGEGSSSLYSSDGGDVELSRSKKSYVDGLNPTPARKASYCSRRVTVTGGPSLGSTAMPLALSWMTRSPVAQTRSDTTRCRTVLFEGTRQSSAATR